MARVVTGLIAFVIFGGLAVVMTRSLLGDRRRARRQDAITGGRRERVLDAVMGYDGWVAVVICAVVAAVGLAMVVTA